MLNGSRDAFICVCSLVPRPDYVSIIAQCIMLHKWSGSEVVRNVNVTNQIPKNAGSLTCTCLGTRLLYICSPGSVSPSGGFRGGGGGGGGGGAPEQVPPSPHSVQ